ncbi:MAG TPA: thioredoxin domain-containing protein [Candidatus Limnocylindria bacterium]|nr:thioredoxin domain-containing protein [Candidatus Limnocylindria bacterium]
MTDAAAGQHDATHAPRHTNRLAGATSPYLLQHAHNPVDWYPWGPEALERARSEDKPIFLSIGYSACHWCHVMERESFENEAIAGQLNRDFVAIKVDREERPDLDDVYMAAVQAMTGGGGWPMSVFLTPELEPFFGGTYFPPEDRHGMPGFPRVLAAVAEAYRERREEVVEQGRQLAAHLREQLEVRPGTTAPEERQLDLAATRLGAAFDAVHGGFGGAPKFPAPMTLEFLLRRWRRTGDVALLTMVTTTLERMADGGINDQLGGGFCRYSTDARWLVPHFEKMLYDNALLAHAYLEAYRATGNPRFAAVARATLDFMLLELRTDQGGLASALDADSEGVEGRYYTWAHDELMAVLHGAGIDDPDATLLATYWGVTEPGNWEGTNVLHRPRGGGDAAVPNPGLVERGRAALLAARAGRVRPGRDDKQLAAWNGLALRALGVAALVLGDDRYLRATADLARFVLTDIIRPDGTPWRAVRDGTAHTPGFAEDHANLADGLLAAYAATAEADHLLAAERLMRRAVEQFWDEQSGTFFDTGQEHDRTFTRPRSLIDSATPSANAVAADVLLRLAMLVGDPEHDRRARRILSAVAPALERQPSAFARMLSAADRSLSEPIDAVVAGRPDDAAALGLRGAVARPYAPDLIVAPLPTDPAGNAERRLANLPLFEGKVAGDGRATAYVCRGYACDAPTADPETARAQVAGLAIGGPRVSPAGS